MARVSKATDYPVVVDGIGKFTVGRRAMIDEIAIQREYAMILGGVEPTAWLEVVGKWIATFKVLIVHSPASWNIDEMDPLEPDTYANLKRVFDAISDKELSFRGKLAVPGEGTSEGPV